MKTRTIAKLISLGVFALVFGTAGYTAHMRAMRLGREEFIARRTASAAAEYERTTSVRDSSLIARD